MEKSIHTAEHQRLARALRARRILAGLKQVELCEKLNVNSTWVSKVETGERRLDLVEMRTLLEALDVTLVEFVTEFERTRPQPAQKRSRRPAT